MSNILFTPILKTKARSEYNALKILENLLLKNDFIIPYIEAIKDYHSKNVNNYIDFFKKDGKPFIFEPLPEDVDTLISDSSILPNYCILSLRVTKTTTKADIEHFIETNRSTSRLFGIKIGNSDDRYLDLIASLKQDELLFIELNGTSIFSSDFLDDLEALNLACPIIVHSNERFQYLRGDDFADDDFNNKSNFNFSIIESIKMNRFKYSGFGSRCSAKDDNTEETKRSKAVRGVFLIYSYKENNFYSLTSDDKFHIGKVYTSFIPKLASHKSDLERKFLNYTPLSKKAFEESVKKTKMASNGLITVSIVRYVEEMLNNL